MVNKRNIVFGLSFALCLGTALSAAWAMDVNKGEESDPFLPRSKRNPQVPVDTEFGDVFEEVNFDDVDFGSGSYPTLPLSPADKTKKPAIKNKYRSLAEMESNKIHFLQYKRREISREQYAQELSEKYGTFGESQIKELNKHMRELYEEEASLMRRKRGAVGKSLLPPDVEAALRRDLEIIHEQMVKGEKHLSLLGVARKNGINLGTVMSRWTHYGFNEYYDTLANNEHIQNLYRELNTKQINLGEYQKRLSAIIPNTTKYTIKYLNKSLKKKESSSKKNTENGNTLRQDLELRHAKMLRGEIAPTLKDLAVKFRVSENLVKSRCVSYGFDDFYESLANKECNKNLALQRYSGKMSHKLYLQQLESDNPQLNETQRSLLKKRLKELYGKKAEEVPEDDEESGADIGTEAQFSEPEPARKRPNSQQDPLQDESTKRKAPKIKLNPPKSTQTVKEDAAPEGNTGASLDFTLVNVESNEDGFDFDEIRVSGESFVNLDIEKRDFNRALKNPVVVYKPDYRPVIYNEESTFQYTDNTGEERTLDLNMLDTMDFEEINIGGIEFVVPEFGNETRAEASKGRKKRETQAAKADEKTIVEYLKERKEQEKKKERLVSLRTKAKEFGIGEFDLLNLKYKHGLDDRIEKLAQRKENQALYLMYKSTSMKKKDFIDLFIGSNENGGRAMHGATVNNVLVRLDYLYELGELKNDSPENIPQSVVIEDGKRDEVTVLRKIEPVSAAQIPPPDLELFPGLGNLLDVATPSMDVDNDGLGDFVFEALMNKPSGEGKRGRESIENPEDSSERKKHAPAVVKADEKTILDYLRKRKEQEKNKETLVSLRKKAKEFGVGEFEMLLLNHKYGLDDETEKLAQKKENQALYLRYKSTPLTKKEFVDLFIAANTDNEDAIQETTIDVVLLRLEKLYELGEIKRDAPSNNTDPEVNEDGKRGPVTVLTDIEPISKKLTVELDDQRASEVEVIDVDSKTTPDSKDDEKLKTQKSKLVELAKERLKRLKSNQVLDSKPITEPKDSIKTQKAKLLEEAKERLKRYKSYG